MLHILRARTGHAVPAPAGEGKLRKPTVVGMGPTAGSYWSANRKGEFHEAREDLGCCFRVRLCLEASSALLLRWR